MLVIEDKIQSNLDIMDKVTIQFNKLKLQGKIKNGEKVNIAKVNNFKAGSDKSKTILYNKNMNELLNDEIDFWLLHEEGHFVHSEKKSFCSLIGLSLLLTVASLCGFGLKWLQHEWLSAIVLLLIYIIILFLIIFLWLRWIYQDFEYKADDYACKNIDNPLEITALFEHLISHSMDEMDKISIIFSNLSHPSIDNRITRILKNYPSFDKMS